jgi:uncharacterized protein YkwD
MHAFLHRSKWRALVILVGLSIACASRADVLGTVDVLRVGGCGGLVPAARPLRHDPQLDRAAQAWAAGIPLAQAVERSGYTALSSSGVRVSGPDGAVMQALRRSRCGAVADPQLRDIGQYQRGTDRWLVLAAPYSVPPASQGPVLVTRALELVNAARARGARCGSRSFAPAAPVTLSATLADVAQGHAADMASHNYFEHQDLAGRSPADRVRATGYREKLVGENIAYGPTTVEEVVRGWLDSPGHCENIMDPRFSEMGLAYSQGRADRRGLYWVQLLAQPRV